MTKKLISAVLAAAMAGSLLGTSVLAEDITVSAVIPANNASAVSVVKDISLNFNTELADALLTKENFAVTSAGNVPDYEIEKSGNTVKLNFDGEFDYDTAYTLTLKNVGEEKSYSFTTEQDPVNVLFKEDFSTLTDLSQRFTNTGDQTSGLRYGIEGKSLTIGGQSKWSVGAGPIATIKGSDNWTDYEVYAEFKDRDWASGVIAFRQQVDTSSASDQTKDGYFLRAGGYGATTINGVTTTSYQMHLDLNELGTSDTPYAYTDTYPAITRETFYGVHLSVEDNKINAHTTNLATGETMNTLSYTDATNKYTKGAVGFGVYYGWTYWDNIKVTDKGLRFAPDKVKNTGSTITLTFNEDIDTSSVTNGSVKIKKNGETVASAVEAVDARTVKAAVLEPELDTEYAITVSKDIKRASDGMGMNNDKTFNILTSENEDDVEIPTITAPIVLEEVTPADGAKAVSVFTDPVISFQTELDESSLSGKIAVTRENGGSVPDFTVAKDGKKAVVKFEKELDYETKYNVVVSAGIKNIYGGATENAKSFSFTTERNEMDVLFEEDFSTLTDLSQRFTNTGDQTSGLRYGIEGHSLNIGGHNKWSVGAGPIATIKGSENWSDYEVYAEFKDRDYASGVIAFRQQVDTSSASNQTKDGYFLRAGGYGATTINGVTTTSNQMHLDLNEFGTSDKPYAYTDTYPSITRETFYGVHLSVEDNKINAHTTNLATGETMNTLSYTDATNKYTKGAVGFGVYYGWTYWDNIKVTDKGFRFTPQQMKNTSNSINLLFNKPIATSSVTNDKVTVKKGDTTVDAIVTAVNDQTVNIQIENAEVNTFYTITVSKDILRASDKLGMNSDKTFKILTSSDLKSTEPIELVAITPNDQAKNADIFTDPVVRFSSAPELTSAKANISVTSENGTVPKYEIKIKGNDAIIKFEKELDYEKTYTVTVNAGIENSNGKTTSEGAAATFTTERNEMDILFEEDFSTLTDLSQRFTNTGDQTSGLRYGIEGKSLNIGGHKKWSVGAGPIATIKGSENWSDYEVYAEFKDRDYASGVIAFRQPVDTSSASNQTKDGYFLRAGGYGATTINGVTTTSNQMHLDLNEFGTYETPYAYTDTYPAIEREHFYGVTLSVEDNKINAHTTDLETGATMNTLSYTDAENKYTKGAVGFGVYYDWTYWDNIKVTDKGFRFTPQQMKNVDGAFSVEFTDDVNKETLAGNIVVTDEDGNAMKTRVTLNGTKKVDVVIVGAENEKEYDVTVKQAVASVNGKTMANDKTFSVTVKLPFEIEDLYVADANGKATGLTAEGKVKGVAKINHLEDKQSYTVVIAVYDETGALYDVLFETVENPIDGINTIKTEEISLPKDVTGYKASVFLMDNLSNIKPLTGKVSIPN